jgi:hypothetical protein
VLFNECPARAGKSGGTAEINGLRPRWDKAFFIAACEAAEEDKTI